MDLAYDCGVRALDNTNNVALGPSLAAIARNSHGNAVAMHSLGCGIGRQEDVARNALHRLIGNEEAKAIPMDGEAASDEWCCVTAHAPS